MHNSSPKLEAVRLTGAEKFTSQQKELEFSALDFWRRYWGRFEM